MRKKDKEGESRIKKERGRERKREEERGRERSLEVNEAEHSRAWPKLVYSERCLKSSVLIMRVRIYNISPLALIFTLYALSGQ